jgi:dihydrofolate reductase
MILSLIAAVGKNGIIGSNGDLPWHLPADMKFFSKTTRGHHVLMGRKNFESIPAKFRPLPGRPNIIVTRNSEYTADGAHVVSSIDAGISYAKHRGEEELFIIGGGEIYQQTIDQAERMYLTHVNAQPEGETHFPSFDPEEWNKEEILYHPKDDIHNYSFQICVYTRKNSTG